MNIIYIYIFICTYYTTWRKSTSKSQRCFQRPQKFALTLAAPGIHQPGQPIWCLRGSGRRCCLPENGEIVFCSVPGIFWWTTPTGSTLHLGWILKMGFDTALQVKSLIFVDSIHPRMTSTYGWEQESGYIQVESSSRLCLRRVRIVSPGCLLFPRS